jgi:uncharacterized protein (DUF2267 family)
VYARPACSLTPRGGHPHASKKGPGKECLALRREQDPLERSAEEAEEFSLEEFYRRVAEREGVDIDTARNDASAVMTVVRMAITPGQLEDSMAQLPSEFNVLFR